MLTPDDLDRKRALIELRESRRWHRMVVAILKKEEDGVYAIFQKAHWKRFPEPVKLKIPENQLGCFALVSHRDYDLKFESVLYRIDHQSDDSCAWVRPPIIVTQADIDAAQKEEI